MTRGRRMTALAVLLALVATGVGVWRSWRPAGPITPQDQPVASPKEADAKTQIQKPLPPDEGFVGSAACRQCHSAIAETYQSHPMARSLTPVKDLVAAENELTDQLVEPPGPRKYRVHCDGKQVWHHESLSDPNGEPLYDQRVEVTYALGSGTRGRAYLLERDGRLFASPLSWYARTQKWGLAPGYPPNSHKRFEREVGQGCLICHTGRMKEAPDPSAVSSSPMFAEAAIGCERCHGPGQRHLDFHTARKQTDAAADGEVDPITNPAKLETAQREDVCNQCHLQGQSQHLRYGRRAFDFRPGMRLEDVWLIYLSDERHSSARPTLAISQVEQMRSSTCYSRSEGRFGCLSCHAAHSVPAPSERADFYRQRCLSCHADAGCKLPETQRLLAPEANSCIACHMPSLGTSNVPHTSQTDHRILRQPEASRVEHAAQSANTSLVLFDQADQRIPQWEAERARGLMLAGLAEKTRNRRFTAEAESLLEATRKIARDDIEVLDWLGVTKMLLGKTPEARAVWQSGLDLDPRRESLLLRLAFFSHDLRDLPAAAGYFDRLFEVNPSHAAFHGRQAHILGQLGNFDRAIQEANRAIELDPTLSQAHEWLAQVHQMRGQKDLSRYHQEMGRKLRQAGF